MIAESSIFDPETGADVAAEIMCKKGICGRSNYLKCDPQLGLPIVSDSALQVGMQLVYQVRDCQSCNVRPDQWVSQVSLRRISIFCREK